MGLADFPGKGKREREREGGILKIRRKMILNGFLREKVCCK